MTTSASTRLPSVKTTSRPSSSPDVRLRRHRAVRDAVEDPAGDRRVRLAELVVGLRQAELRRVADVAVDQLGDEPAADLERDPRAGHRAAELVGRLAEDVLRDDVRAAPRREVDVVGHVRGLDRDVHRAVADAEHDDLLAAPGCRGSCTGGRAAGCPRRCPTPGTPARASARPSGGRWRRRARRSARGRAPSIVSSQVPSSRRSARSIFVSKRIRSRRPKLST